jgi:hypothetical protein
LSDYFRYEAAEPCRRKQQQARRFPRHRISAAQVDCNFASRVADKQFAAAMGRR